MAAPVITSYSVGAGQPINGGRWPGGRLASALGLGDVLAAGALASNAAALAGAVGLDDGVAAGRLGSPIELVADGIWTWFTDHRAVERSNGNLLVMVVDSAGTNWLHERDKDSGAITSVQLSTTGLEVDDHNNGSVFERADGRLVVMYGTHNDTVFRYKVSNTSSILGGWSSEQQRGTGQGPYSYPYVFQLSQDTTKFWYFNRRWTTGAGTTRTLSYRTTTALVGSSDPWGAYTDVWQVANKIPYWRRIADGVNKMHVVTTDMHPVEGQASLYHFYMQLDGSNNPLWYKSDGTQISASLPFGTADATLIYDGSTTKCWVSDLVIDGSGHPRVLYMRYPGNDGSAIEYWHARWTGSAWVSHKICDDGAGLYSGEPYYPGVICFDSLDPSIVYPSAPISGVRQIQRLTTADDGATWAQAQVITSGGTAGNPLRLRPYSPKVFGGSRQGPAVLWAEGRYTSFTDYDTAIKGSL